MDHLPLNRQSDIYERQGVNLERSTLADWVGGASTVLRPLINAIQAHVMAATKLHADDTPVPVLQPGRSTTKQGRLWAYVRDDAASNDPTPPAVWFTYTSDRKGIHPQQHLKDFTGIVQADGYAGHKELFKDGKATKAACWAHARRKFFELAQATGSPMAREALQKIAQLYAIEQAIRGNDANERQRIPQEQALPLLADLKQWLLTTLAQTPKNGASARAIGYSLNRWTALTNYANDGRIEIDNNIVERQIRPIALGRKNYLFAGSDNGGHRAAAMYSLLGNAKMYGLSPEAYLKFVFERINDHKVNAINELLPWNVPAHLTIDAAQHQAQTTLQDQQQND
jgi:transposase